MIRSIRNDTNANIIENNNIWVALGLIFCYIIQNCNFSPHTYFVWIIVLEEIRTQCDICHRKIHRLRSQERNYFDLEFIEWNSPRKNEIHDITTVPQSGDDKYFESKDPDKKKVITFIFTWQNIYQFIQVYGLQHSISVIIIKWFFSFQCFRSMST